MILINIIPNGPNGKYGYIFKITLRTLGNIECLITELYCDEYKDYDDYYELFTEGGFVFVGKIYKRGVILNEIR